MNLTETRAESDTGSELDDRIVLNLGCGTRTSRWCTNIDWTPYVRVARRPLLRKAATALLRGERARKLEGIAGTVMAHDLRKGIPFDDDSVDAVYLSHVLEHIDRDAAPGFLREIHRSLKPGGIVRIAVPDFEFLCRQYLSTVDLVRSEQADAGSIERHMEALLEQSVRRTSRAIPSSAPRPVRALGTLVLGDARGRGETHQWMYDGITLPKLLLAAGFAEADVTSFDRSAIPGWSEIDLDREQGSEYKPGSLYVEGTK